MYNSDIVADANIAGLPSTHVRKHPNTKDGDEAT